MNQGTEHLLQKIITLLQSNSTVHEKQMDILLLLKQQKDTTTEQLNEILATAIALNYAAEQTHSLIKDRIDQLGSIEDLHSFQNDQLFNTGQKILIDRFTTILMNDLGKSATFCMNVLKDAITDLYGSGKVIDTQVDRNEQENYWIKIIERIKLHGISDVTLLLLYSYIDMYLIAMTVMHRTNEVHIFKEMNSLVSKINQNIGTKNEIPIP